MNKYSEKWVNKASGKKGYWPAYFFNGERIIEKSISFSRCTEAELKGMALTAEKQAISAQEKTTLLQELGYA